MSNFRKICNNIYNNILKKIKYEKETVKLIIKVFAYTYIYFSLFYLLKISIFNIIRSNLLFYNLLLFIIYIVLFASTFLIKSRSPYKIIVYLLLLQIFL